MGESLIEAIRSRRSVRGFRRKGVPLELVRKVLQVATCAPSAHNAQPWRFVVVKESSVKRRLAEAMAKAYDSDLRRDGAPKEMRERLTKASVLRLTEAPILIVACLTMEGMDRYPDRRRKVVELVMATQSLSAAVQNLLLAAHAMGLGTCWLCAPLFAPRVVRGVLKIPGAFKPQAFILLGYPDETPKAPERLPLDEIVCFDGWCAKGP